MEMINFVFHKITTSKKVFIQIYFIKEQDKGADLLELMVIFNRPMSSGDTLIL